MDYENELQEFVEKLKKKAPEIIGIYFMGSTATKAWDEYSDIDVDVVIEDKDFDKFCKKLPALLRLWGKVKFSCNYPNHSERWAYIGDDYLKVEIDPIKKSRLKNGTWLKNVRIVYDKEGLIKKAQRKFRNFKKPGITHKEVNDLFLRLRDSQFYTARHCARGQRFSAMSESNNVGAQLFWFLAKLKGMEDYELIRRAEEVLSEKEKKFLEDSKCHNDNKKEIKRAMKVNWSFMKYLEKKYGKKLDLPSDREVLRKIEEIYERG